MARPSAALSLFLAVCLPAVQTAPAWALTAEEARALDISSIFSPAQLIVLRALNSDPAVLGRFYDDLMRAKNDEAAGNAAAVQSFAESWRTLFRQRATALLAENPADLTQFPAHRLAGFEEKVSKILNGDEYVLAQTRGVVPARQLGSTAGTLDADLEIIARNRLAVRRFLAYVAAQPTGALGTAEQDWNGVRDAVTHANLAGSLAEVRTRLAATAPRTAPAAATPEPKKEDFVRVFGPATGERMHSRFSAELRALDRRASDYEARRRRVVETWQGRLNKGPLEARVGMVFQNRAERALAVFLAKSWGGKTGDEAEAAFSEELDKALGGDGPARQGILAKAREAAAAHLKDANQPSGLKAVLEAQRVDRNSLVAFYCAVDAGAPGAGGERGAAGARAQGDLADSRAPDAQTTTEGASRAADFTNTQTGTPVSAQPPAGPIDPALEAECRQWRDADLAQRENAAEAARQRAASRRSAAYNSEVPGGGTQIRPDKEDSKAAKEKEKAAKGKTDFKRAVIGGMGGALVLGVFGFIFGGPVGALAMGAVGFALMAGVSYINNNPIE
ncbi:MAG: hypothetical protein HYZ75_19800 [Elusimicrobia bacterium]|nr:hypothetical protein [Elusimicrobiota bacterium]